MKYFLPLLDFDRRGYLEWALAGVLVLTCWPVDKQRFCIQCCVFPDLTYAALHSWSRFSLAEVISFSVTKRESTELVSFREVSSSDIVTHLVTPVHNNDLSTQKYIYKNTTFPAIQIVWAFLSYPSYSVMWDTIYSLSQPTVMHLTPLRIFDFLSLRMTAKS